MEVYRDTDARHQAELVAKIRNGDEQAEEELFRRYRGAVTIIINQSWRQCPITADICQDTLHTAIQNIRDGILRDPDKLSAYIWGIAHNLIIKYLRDVVTHKAHGIEEAEDLCDSAPNQLDLILGKEKSRIVRQLLDELRSERDRQVLYRFYILEEDKEIICSDLRLTPAQFNVVLFRARKQYRRLYEKFVAKTYR